MADIASYCSECPFKGPPQVLSEGDPETCKYVLVGEAPAHDEVRQGRPFVGATGRLLMAFMKRVGIEREECYITNALLCRIPHQVKKNSVTMLNAKRYCRERLLEELASINTGATIWLMGAIARDALYPAEQGKGILAARGWRKWNGRDVFVGVHPAYYLYNPNDAPMLLTDLRRVKRGRLQVIKKFEVARAIPLTQGKYAWVSDEDYDYLMQWKWWINNYGYAMTDSCGRSAMHRLILERQGQDLENLEGDHINRSRLDNRRSNLRPVTVQQQRWNSSGRTGLSKSKYKGVGHDHHNWFATASAEGESQWLGYFDTEEEAAHTYDAAAKERYGEYAYLNFPEEKLEWTGWVLDTKELLEEFIKELHSKPLEERGYISFDIETMQVDYMRDRILCLSITSEFGTAYIVPDSLLYQDGHEFVTTGWTKKQWERFESDERYVTGSYLKPNPNTVALLRELWAIPGYRWAAHNSKFDMRFLYHLGIENVHCDFDTIVAHYTLDERRGGHGLKALADDELDVGDYEHDLFNYIAKKSGHYSNVPRDVLYPYNSMDTELTLRLAYELEKELKEQGLYERPFLFPLMEAVPALLDMELYGVGIDWEEVDRIEKEELVPELAKLKQTLQEMSGHPDLNPLSSQKINNILYDECKFPIIEVRTRAAGKRIRARSSQVAVMDGWTKMWKQGILPVSKEAWEFVKILKQYRHLRKLQGSYIRKWRKFRGTDDRVHSSFLLRGTVTGRLASKDPPLQTIPSKVADHWGPLIANIHVPKPGWKLLYADYSQAELMAAACMSGDEFMLDTFRKEGADYHSEVARSAFGDDFTHDDRQHSKRLTFGWLYGGNVYEIALNALQFEGNVAERFAKEWDNLFKGVVAWRKAQGELIQQQGYVESVFGRRRRYILLTSKNIGKAKRVAVNAPIQSAVSDLTLISAIRLYKKYRGADYANVVLLIHDSLIMEVRDDKVEEVAKVMYEIMLDVPREVFPQVPFQAEIKIGTRLGDLT